MNLTQVILGALILSHYVDGVRKLRRNHASLRKPKSYENSFPFNANEKDEDQHEDFKQQDGRVPRQDDLDIDVGFQAVAAAGPREDGKKCIDKVEMIEETEYDDVIQCDHSYDK